MVSKYFDPPFANSGDKTSIPDASQPSGNVSFEDGWTPDYSKDQSTDPTAKDVSRQSENYFKFTVTEALKEMQEIGAKPYSALVNYPVGAKTPGSNGLTYKCIVKNGPAASFLPVVNPVGDVTGTWLLADSRDYSTLKNISVDETLTVADVGKALNLVKVGSLNMDLPVANTVVRGQTIDLSTAQLTNGIATISRQSTDVIVIDGVTSVTSFTMAPASDMVLVSNGVDTWHSQSGLAKLKSAVGEFAFLKSTNGYQKFPSGIIVQWLAGLTVAGTLAVNFPITFPTALVGISLTGNTSNAVINYNTESATGLTVNSVSGSTGGPVAAFFKLIVIGY